MIWWTSISPARLCIPWGKEPGMLLSTAEFQRQTQSLAHRRHSDICWTWIIDSGFIEGRCLALQSGFIGGSYNTEDLLMTTYSFWGRFSSSRKATFPNWHKNQRVKDELFGQRRKCTPRYIHKPSVCEDVGRFRPHPQPYARENWGRRKPLVPITGRRP